MITHETYMHRCLQLARLGAGFVAPNPMVGAVLVYQNRIIGEGYHALYGREHAEVNCINSVQPEDQHLIPLSTIYVSLEPCAHFGKTPPCADLIIAKGIQSVVVGCRDPFEAVNGKGIEKLEKAGIKVIVGVLEQECLDLNKRFFTFHTKRRPYIILKWAQTANRMIGTDTGNNRLLITNEFTNRLVHRWRREEAAILIGTNTAMADNPQLTNRLWVGPSPVRLVIDARLRLPETLQLFTQGPVTIVFNYHAHSEELTAAFLRSTKQGTYYYRLNENEQVLPQIWKACYLLQLLSVFVEGGAFLQQSCINSANWDEARVLTNDKLEVVSGIAAPVLSGSKVSSTEYLLSDRINTYLNKPNKIMEEEQ